MAATKPTKYPEWADGGSAVIIEPSDAKKALGWVVEKPPYQFFNWLFNLLFLWVEWFDQGFVAIQHITASGTTTLAVGTKHVMADATAGNQTVQLPDVTSLDGMKVSVTKIDSSVNTITLQAQAGKTVNEAQTQVIGNQYTTLTAVAYGGNWYLS